MVKRPYFLSVRLSEDEKRQYDSLVIHNVSVDPSRKYSESEIFRMLLDALSPRGRSESWRNWAKTRTT